MAQLSLFDLSDLVINEGRGRFISTPGFIDPSLASRWLGELRARVAWRTQKRMMYDREVDVPRLLGHFRLDRCPCRDPCIGRSRHDRQAPRARQGASFLPPSSQGQVVPLHRVERANTAAC